MFFAIGSKVETLIEVLKPTNVGSLSFHPKVMLYIFFSFKISVFSFFFLIKYALNTGAVSL